MKESSNLANVAYFLIITLIGGYLLSIGKALFVPIIFAIILAFLLYPFCKKLEAKKFPRILAILTSMLGVALLLAGLIILFTNMFASLFEDLENFKAKILVTIERLEQMVEGIPLLKKNVDPMIENGGSELMGSISTFLGSTILSTTAFVGYLGMVTVYLFLFLLYRSAFKKFILSWFKGTRQNEMEIMLFDFQKVVQNYSVGLLISVTIIGTVNSLGLFIIGIEHAILFGFFASFLSIVPYIGTTLGGLLPFFFALVNYEEPWKAIAVIVFYQVVQQVEGNFITPKIVGDKVSVNPLIAIVALIAGGFFWGIAGMVLSLPLVAIMRIYLNNFESTKPFAHLLSNKFSDD